MERDEYLKKLNKYDDEYYNLGSPSLTDTDYDILRSNFYLQFPDDPYFKQVGISVKFDRIKLPFLLGGLDKVDVETVESWAKDLPDIIIASEKLDGNSIGCTWENGKLIFSASRGDGETGQNILNKVKYFVPDIPIKEKVSLRGEILLEGNLFKELGFKNRRNAVTGLLRRDDIKPDILKKLTVIFYEVIEPTNFETEEDRLIFIQNELKLKTCRFGKVIPTIYLIPTLTSFLFHLKESSNYDIDGLVLTLNNSQRENTKHPKNKVKFKVNEEATKCKVLGVEWNVTRMGYVKPVILIEPTEIMGVTVSRVSGFNFEYIFINGIGKGSVIGVVRSGDVIPYVTEVFQSVETNFPTWCPTCKKTLTIKSKELICNNPDCFYQNIYETSHFFTSMGVEFMSDKTIENIGITSIQEIYNLTKENLEKLPGFGEKKAEIIINEVKKTLITKPEKLLAAFGIPMIGRTLSKQLCSKFTLDDLFEIKDPEVLGLGPITSKSLIDNIENYRELYKFLKSKGLKFIEEDMSTKTLKGTIFALTGEGPMKRSEIQKKIEALGGEVKGIGKETTYLVTNDPDSNSGKMKSAQKYGTNVIGYDELFSRWLK